MDTQDVLNSLLLLDAWQVPTEHYSQVFAEQIKLATDLNLEPNFDIPQINPYAPLEF